MQVIVQTLAQTSLSTDGAPHVKNRPGWREDDVHAVLVGHIEPGTSKWESNRLRTK